MEAAGKIRGSIDWKPIGPVHSNTARIKLEHQAILRCTPHGLCIFGPGWNIRWANQAMMRMLGMDAGRADSRTHSFKTFFDSEEAFRRFCDSAMGAVRAGETDLREIELKRLDGKKFWGELSLVRYDPSQTGVGYVGTLTDITDRLRAEAQVRDQLNRLAALRTIDAAITASVELPVVLNIILEQAIAQLRMDAATILLFDQSSQHLEFAAGRGLRGQSLRHSRLRMGEGYAGLAASNRRRIHIPDLGIATGEFARSRNFNEEGFVAYFAVPLLAKGALKGVLEVFHRSSFAPDQGWLDFLDAIAGQAAIALDNACLFEGLQRSNQELRLAYDNTLEGWVRALDLRDHETEGHSQRVTETTLRLAFAMGIKDEQLVNIRRGALLHDIGKLGIPDSILLKPGPLTVEEREIMKRHPSYAFEWLSTIPYLYPALDIPYCHHEMWNGTGYPRGLIGEAIPLAARIFAVVDVWDSLRTDRPYRKAWAETKVRAHLKSLAGTHFDPRVVDKFLSLDP